MSDETPFLIDALEVRHVTHGDELYREVYIRDIYIGRVKVEPA